MKILIEAPFNEEQLIDIGWFFSEMYADDKTKELLKLFILEGTETKTSEECSELLKKMSPNWTMIGVVKTKEDKK